MTSPEFPSRTPAGQAASPPSKPISYNTGIRLADDALAYMRGALGDSWEVWAVAHLTLSWTFSAKPVDAPAAVMFETDPDDLIAAALEYEENLAVHLVAERRRLTTAANPDERRTLRQLVSALEQLQVELLAVPADVDDCGREYRDA